MAIRGVLPFAVAVTLGITAACGQTGIEVRPEQATAAPPGVEAANGPVVEPTCEGGNHATYRPYASLQELTDFSPLVVVGHIEKRSIDTQPDVELERAVKEKLAARAANPEPGPRQSPAEVGPNRETEPSRRGDPNALPEFTTTETWSQLRVSDVIKGSAKPGEVVLVRTWGNDWSCDSNNPPPALRGRYLVFLSPSNDGNGYYVSGGNSVGRLIVDGADRVQPIPLADSPPTKGLFGQRLAEARRQIAR